MFIITSDDTIIEIDQTRFFPDAFTDEQVNMSWSKPTHAIANGFTKSDGIFKAPKQLSLSGCVSRQAINKRGIDPFEGAEDRTVAACNFIEAMGDARDCVTIDAGSGKVHTNMVLVGAPVRFEVGGVMRFDLFFEELQTFAISETFDGTLGQRVNIGEVTTVEAEPDIIPDLPSYTPTPSTRERLDYTLSNPEPFDACDAMCDGGVFCLDGCYENAFFQAGF